MLMDTAEQEEAFFRYENNFLMRQSGYYIYYEKNTQMQNYMLEKNPEIQEESQETVQDDAVRAFRSLIQKKKKEEPEETEEKTSVFSYAATACIVLALAVVGVRFYRNIRWGRTLRERQGLLLRISCRRRRLHRFCRVCAAGDTDFLGGVDRKSEDNADSRADAHSNCYDQRRRGADLQGRI